MFFLASARFWSTTLWAFINFGAAVNYYNNAGSIILSLGGTNTQVSWMLFLFAFAQVLIVFFVNLSRVAARKALSFNIRNN